MSVPYLRRLIISAGLVIVLARDCLAAEPPVLTDREAARILVAAPKTQYPREARRRRIEGTGVFQMLIDKTGKVTAVKVTKSTGHRILDVEAARTLLRWRFKPGSLDRANEEIVFELD